MAKQSALNPKLVQKSKEKAIVDAEKNIKQFEKIQRKASKKAEKEEKQNERNRRKLLEPIQLTNNNNRLQPVEYSTLTTTGTLRWTTANKTKNKNKDLPLKFSDLVNNNANTIQRTNQFNNLLSNVKGTLTTGTSSRLARSLGSLGAVSRKVQLKKQHNNSDEQTAGQKADEQDSKAEKQQTNQGVNNDLLGSKNVLQNSTIKNNLTNNNPTVRSLTGLCRDADVLYVRKETDYGLINYSDKQNTPLMTANCINTLNNLTKKNDLNRPTMNESNREEKKNSENETRSLANNSVKSLDNNNNKRNLDKKDDTERTKFRLKELFANKSYNENNSLYYRNNRTIRQNSININKISTLFKRGLTRATSESDIIHELRKGESNCLKNSSSLLNRVENRSQMIQSTTKLNSLNNSPTNSLNSTSNGNSSANGSIFERPGFGSVAFRQNLFAQVLQLSKQLNDDNYEQEGLDNVETFKRTLNNRIKPVSIGKKRLLLSVHKPGKPITTALNKNSNNNTNQTHLPNLQLIKKMNKQLRKNKEENDSIGNSVESSLSSRSTNSSTNSTLSSNLIETELELTDDLNMKLSSKTIFKTRKSLKLIEQQQNVNQHEIDEKEVQKSSNEESNEQIKSNDQKVDNQVTVQTADKISEEKKIENEERKKAKEKQFDQKMTEEETELKKDNQLKNDEICLKNIENLDNLDNETNKKVDDKIDKKIDQKDKFNRVEENEQNDERKQTIAKETTATATKKYCETYERLNRQTLNSRIETLAKTNKLNDKLYEKKNDKLLKIKDKFLNRMNARQGDEKARLNDATHDKQAKKIGSINNLLNESSDDSADCSLNKEYEINQLEDHLENSWNQNAGTEIAIEKICTTVFCKSNEASAACTSLPSSVPIENKIKKFENLNCARNESMKKDVSDSHVYKLVVKNRELNELMNTQNDRNSLSISTSNASSKNSSFNLLTPSSNLQSSSTAENSTTNSNLPLNSVNERDTVRNAVKNEANLPAEKSTKNLSTFKNTLLNTSSSSTIAQESKLPITNSTLNNKVRTNNQSKVNLNSFNSDHKNGFRNYENVENKTVNGINSRMNIELFLANQTTNNLLEDTCL